MNPIQLLFIFSHPPDSDLATSAWDAAMTAGLLNQSVTVLFSGEGLEQIRSPFVIDKIKDLQELFPLRLCAEGSEAVSGEVKVELISSSALPEFHQQFQRILSF